MTPSDDKTGSGRATDDAVLQESNPVDTGVAYGGNATHYGQPNDPMVGKEIGGVNVFGGGLGLYANSGELVGGLGVSGDTSHRPYSSLQGA